MSAAPKSKPSPIEAFLALTPGQRDEVVREFDQEFIADTFQPMTPQERAWWERAQHGLKKRKPEPRTMVSALLPQSLIREIDALAKSWQCSRAHVVRLGVGEFLRHRRKS